ncbi:MAG: ATP-dependent zinc metalloprotease FtsH [Candidatus Sabulitectum sp.]|nr:ATP-dependent zinc metalloprotease FtsH [Candidatus Sabulitectum sp.]
MLGLLAYVLVIFLGTGSDRASITYSELLEYAGQGKVESAVLSTGGDVEGEFRSPQIIGNGESTQEYLKYSSFVPFEDSGSIDLLREHGVDVSGRGPNGFLAILINIGPILLFIILWIFIMRRMSGGGQAFSFGKSKAKLITGDHPKNTFEDVAGCDEAKQELEEVIEFLKEPAKFQKLGGKIPKGVLLIGPPGTGKTLLARAVAGEAKVPFFSMSGSDFVEMFVGVGASRVRDLFVQAKSKSPSIIFIDEIDAVGRQRGTGLGGGHDEREQTLNALLVEMDGFADNQGVIVIAATNRPDVLDAALLRPGRFDRRITVGMPDVKGREAILKVHTVKMPLHKEVELSVIARRTPGFSGADLESLANEAALHAARRDADSIEMRDFENAVDRIIMGIERRSMVMTEEERKLTAVHESGHAIVNVFSPQSDPFHKVTIVPRGQALGVTSFLPKAERHNYSLEYCKTVLARLLGGRGAEKLFLDTMSTGAGNDLDRATDLARKMVCNWGMSPEIGPVSFSEEHGPVFLGRDFARTKSYSEHTARVIDDEIRRIMGEAYKAALAILEENRDIVERLSEDLLEKETVSSAEIKEMLAELRPGMDFPGLDSPDYDEPPTEDKEDTTEEVNNDGPEESGAGSEADPGGDRGES